MRRRKAVVGRVYVLHIDPSLKHAAHYIGWTEREVEERLAEHKAGRGSPLVAAALAQGSEVVVANTIEGVTRAFERKLKRKHRGADSCALCKLAKDRERQERDFVRSL